MLANTSLDQLPGKAVVDGDGTEIGSVDDVFAYSASSDAPAWAAVLVEGSRKAVPLVDAELGEDGSIRVPYKRSLVASGPTVEGDQLDASAQLYEHYGLSDAAVRDDTGNPADAAGHARDGGGEHSRDPRPGDGRAVDAQQGHP
jgi:sporulation protein YlmC with PRC-barrel domain